MTGATGFLGTNLVRRLLDGGERVRVLARSTARASELVALGAEVVAGDITDPKAVAAAVDGVDVVYHLAGRLFIPGVPETEYRRTHVDGTRVLLRQCQEHEGLRRFVHCSTTGVLGATGDNAAGENAPFAPTNAYEATKAEAELAVREAWALGFPAVIIRPGLVYGPGDMHLLGFFRAVLRHQFRPIGRVPVWLHPIYVDDMTEGMVLAAEHPAALWECFHIAGRQPATLAMLADAIARAAGTTLRDGHIPMAAARALAAVGDRLPPRLRRSAPMTSSRLDFLTHSRVYDVSKAGRVIGFSAATELADGIARTVAWYRRMGYLPAAAHESAA